jgi:hypothetical protein
MLPLRLRLFERFYAPQTAALAAAAAADAADNVPAAESAAAAEPAAPLATTADAGSGSTTTSPNQVSHRLARAKGTGTITPLPRTVRSCLCFAAQAYVQP